MNGVVALGRHAGPFLDQTTHVVHIDPGTVTDLAGMHTMVREQVSLQGAIVVVYPTTLGAAPERLLRTVRTAMNGPPVLWHATGLPPLAADVMVTLAGALSERIGGAAIIAAALGILERQLIHLTWVPSVAGLTDPAPTLWQHALSALPNTSWIISSWPEAGVWRLASGEVPPIPRPTQDVGVVVADLSGNIEWIRPTVTSQLPDAIAIQVDPPADTAIWWGCKQATQVVLYPRSVEQLTDALLDRLDPGECRWCRRLSGDQICPWCQLPRSGVTKLETHEEDAGAMELFAADEIPTDQEVAAT